MKGCLSITKKKSRIAARVILIVLVLAFLALAAAVLLNTVRHGNEDQQNNFTFHEIICNGSDGFVAHNKAYATIPATDGIELISGIQQGENFNMKACTHTGIICFRIECNPISQ